MKWHWLPLLVTILILVLAPAAFASHPPDPSDWVADFGEAGELGDDDCGEVVGIDPVLFYGVSYESFWINSNGNVTFDECNTEFDDLATVFAESLMAAPLFGDWDPSEGGDVWLNVLEDGTVVVTWAEVPEFSDDGDSNTFQAAIYPNGTIRFSYQHLETDGLNWTDEDMIVGVSSGTLVVAEGEEIPELEGSSLYLCWDGSGEYFLAGDLSCGAVPALNRFHPKVADSLWAPMPYGQDGVDVIVYSANHWGDQFEFRETTHEGGGVAFIGAPDGDYHAVLRWCRDEELRVHEFDFSFPDNGSNVGSPLIDLSEVEYEVVSSC